MILVTLQGLMGAGRIIHAIAYAMYGMRARVCVVCVCVCVCVCARALCMACLLRHLVHRCPVYVSGLSEPKFL